MRTATVPRKAAGMRGEMTLRMIRYRPPSSSIKIDTSPMDPPCWPSSICPMSSSGSLPLCRAAMGVGEVTASISPQTGR